MPKKRNTASERGIYKLNDPKRAKPYVYQRVYRGRRTRTFFRTLEEALNAKRAAERAALNTGADIRFVFDGAMQREYFTAKRILAGEADLIRVAMEWKQMQKKQAQLSRKPLEEVAEEYLRSLRERQLSSAYIHGAKVAVSRLLRAFPRALVSSLESRQIEELLRGYSGNAVSVKSLQKKVSSFFAFAKAKGYIAEVPKVDNSLLPKVKKSPVEVYGVEETRNILRFIARKRPSLLTNFVLRIFCGLRTAEAKRMKWDYIDEREKRIVIPADVCKTGDDWILQTPTLPETVFRWLACVPAKEKRGSVRSPSANTGKRISKELNLKRNAFRHTFCTMHISLCESAEKTALLLRHQGIGMLYRHYLAKLVPKATAEEFFSLTPENTL